MIVKNVYNLPWTEWTKRMLVLVVFLSAGYIDGFAQDASYSQFLNNPMNYNPAHAGNSLGLRARLNHRNQWNNLASNYNNYSFSLDVAEPSIPGAGGLALMVQSDIEGLGSIRTNSVTLSNSARILIAKNIVTQVGLSVAYAERSVDWGGFVFTDQLDPMYGNVRESNFLPPDYNRISYPDFGMGIMLQYFETSRFFNHIVGTFSASLLHAFRPNVSLYGNGTRLPQRIVVMGNLLLDNETGGSRSSASSDFFFKLNPGFLFESQGELTNFVLGANAYKNYIYAGLWIRSQNFTYSRINDLICVAGLHIPLSGGSRMKFVYSYDYVISDMRRTIGSTHEFSVVFELDAFSLFGGTDMTERRRLGRGRLYLGYPDNPAF